MEFDVACMMWLDMRYMTIRPMQIIDVTLSLYYHQVVVAYIEKDTIQVSISDESMLFVLIK